MTAQKKKQLVNRVLTLDADARVQGENLIVIIATLQWLDDDTGPLWVVTMVLGSETKVPQFPPRTIKLFGILCVVEWLQMMGPHVEIVIPPYAAFLQHKTHLEIVVEALTQVFAMCHQIPAEEIKISPVHITDFTKSNDSAP